MKKQEPRDNLNADQKHALKALGKASNVFLTGEAGTGKSFVLERFLESSEQEVQLLATTGMAALLIDGRTFHSFFGLYKFDAPVNQMVKAALDNHGVRNRLKKADCIVIDEVSMLDERTMMAGEHVARKARKKEIPWGGLRVIAVGDFCQLPPVTRGNQQTAWVFDAPIWQQSNFQTVQLQEVMRTKEVGFLEILSKIRRGICDPPVRKFLQSRTISERQADAIEGTRLFARRDTVEQFNRQKLDQLDTKQYQFDSTFTGKADARDKIKRLTPFPSEIIVKKQALVMIRDNDPKGFPYRYANGSLGYFQGTAEDAIIIQLLNGQNVKVEKKEYQMRNGDGKVIATATNFPINLAWASTIHKAQGATLDRVVADIGSLWDFGQAYVALSRVRKAEDLSLTCWSPRSIKMHPRVCEFYGFPTTSY